MSEQTQSGASTTTTENSAKPQNTPGTTTDKVGVQQQVITVHLQNIPLLKNLEQELLGQIGKTMIFRSYSKGAFILHKGGTADYLVFLLTGQLQVVDITDDGRIVGLSFLYPGEYTGELSIIDTQPRSASVIANENSLVALLPQREARQLIYRHPLVAERVLTALAEKVRSATTYRTLLGIPSVTQRVYAYIEKIARPGPGNSITIENFPTQQEIAIMINTSRETVSRALRGILEQRVVEKDGRRLIVRDPAKLHELILASSSAN